MPAGDFARRRLEGDRVSEVEVETARGERLDACGVTAAVRGMIDEAVVGSSPNDLSCNRFCAALLFDLSKIQFQFQPF